jgi:hypothetical protein
MEDDAGVIEEVEVESDAPAREQDDQVIPDSW